MYHTITKFLDEPYINFVIKNNSLQGLREPIFNMLRPLLPLEDNILLSGFSKDSKIINGNKTHIQRNKTFRNHENNNSLYCVMIFLNDCYNNGKVKLHATNNYTVMFEMTPKKGDCLIFDNNMYYSYEPYELRSKVDRMILKTYLMGISNRNVLYSPPTSPMIIPTRKLSIRKELSTSPTSPIFELSPITTPSLSPIRDRDRDRERERTMSDPDRPLSVGLPLGRLGSHRLTSNSMSELPSVTPVSSPVNNLLPTSYSDMEKSTIYKRLSKLYKKK